VSATEKLGPQLVRQLVTRHRRIIRNFVEYRAQILAASFAKAAAKVIGRLGRPYLLV
jgi:hypothetical protein